MGHRRVVIQDLQQRSIVAGISQAWQDYAQQHDIMIRVVWPQPAPLVPPQPVLTVIVQILDPFRHIAPNVLLEQRTNAGWDDSPQVMTTRAAEYLLAQTNGHEVLRLLRMQNSCQPRGLRRCRIQWRGHYHSPDDLLQPRAGDYIISLADSLDIHFRNSESYFHHARRFALDGQRIMSQVCNVRTIEIDVHAIGTRNFPLGARVLTITMDWLIRPRDIWSQAVALWADRDANENSKLYHVDQQPSLTQSNPQDVLHLLLVIAPASDVVPVLFGLTLVSSVTEELVAFCPSLCETPTDDQSLLRHSTYHRLVRALSGTFAIYSGYNQIGHSGNVDIPPGTMLTVQVTHRSRHQILHLLLDRLDAADSSTDSEEMSETPDLQQPPNTTALNEARPSSNTRCTSLPSTFGASTLGAIIALRRNMWLGIFYASLLFLHPCRQLPPPGNGAWTGEDLQDHDLPPILDTRTHADLDALEGFVIEDRYVLLYEIPQRPASIRFELPFTLNQAISHFDAWPSGVLQYDYAAIPDLHPVAESFIHSAVPFDPEHVDTIDIFVDGSTSKDDDHDLIASYAFVATTTSNNINGCAYSLYGFAGGCVSLQQQDSAWMGATHIDSMEAERCAVISALQWILQADLAWDVPVTVHFDCTAAGFAASGDWHVRADSLTAHLARCYCQVVQELLKNRLKLVHVPGHANVPGNELADSIAKAVAKQQLPSTLNMLDHRAVVQLVQEHGSWAWMRFGILNGSIDLPHLEGDQASLPAVLTPTHSFDDIDLAPFDVTCDEPSESRLFNVCTLNVRSLSDDPSSVGHHRKFTEKAQYLADQLHWYGYHIVGLQESCSRHQGVSSFGNYIRAVGGCDEKGQLGCELWISRTLGKHAVTAKALVCLHSDPRRLLIRLQHCGLDLSLAVLHARHNGYDDDRLSQWWVDTKRVCQLLDPGNMIVLIDSNAQTPTPTPPYVGDLTHGKTSKNTMWLIDFCTSMDTFLPTTFTSLHTGEIGTWHHPSGTVVRIDYVLVPRRWISCLTSTWTDTLVDLNQTTPDHRPVGCQIQLLLSNLRVRKTGYNLHALKQPYIKEKIDQALRDMAPIPWDTDVHRHAQILRENIHGILAEHVPLERGGPRQSFISDTTWGIRSRKREVKKLLQNASMRLCILWQRWAFTSWQCQIPLCSWYRPHLLWLLRYERHMAIWRLSLRELVHKTKQSLQKDRTQYLDGIADTCAHQPLHQVFQSLRRIGIGACYRKRARQPLPSFRQADGTLSSSEFEMAECWRQHCHTLEAGEIVSTKQLMNWVTASSHHRSYSGITVDHIPSLTDLEKHLRKMKPGKATGLDKVPSDICHYCAGAMGRTIFPLLLKEAFTATEPVEHKGGALVYAYKGKGRHDDVTVYRGLMLTSVVGKSIRSAFREKMLPGFRQYLHQTYFSARACGHVGQACMTLQLFSRVASRLGHSASIVFLDIRSAYYAICRELATGWSGSDQQLLHILRHFDMPDNSIAELHKTFEAIGGATSDAGLDEQHQSILTELSTATWFRVRGSPHTTQTHGGSRPGDGLADVLFAFIFGRMLRMLKQELCDCGYWDPREWALEIPRSQLLHQSLPPDDTPASLDVVWADDLSLALRDPDAAFLVERTQHVTACLFDWCYRYGMSPNVNKGKSEILLQLRGSRSRSVRLELYSPDEPRLSIPTVLAPAVELHLVPMYKHLGAQMHVGAELLKEIQIRGGMMRSVYNQYARKVFRNPKLPLRQRGQLLDSLIFSILRWNQGAWYELDKQTFAKYRSSVMTLARRTCLVPHGSGQVWSWKDEEVLAELNMASPEEMQHIARIGFYTTAYHTAPDALWTLILAEGTWLRCVRNAVYWMFCQLCNSTPHTIYHEFENEWLQGVHLRGAKWRGWIARAKKHAILQMQFSAHSTVAFQLL